MTPEERAGRIVQSLTPPRTATETRYLTDAIASAIREAEREATERAARIVERSIVHRLVERPMNPNYATSQTVAVAVPEIEVEQVAAAIRSRTKEK